MAANVAPLMTKIPKWASLSLKELTRERGTTESQFLRELALGALAEAGYTEVAFLEKHPSEYRA